MDISQDIEWEQNFEFDQKLQQQINNDDNDKNNSLSQHQSTTDDDDNDNILTDDDMDGYKRARKPSNAELLDRVLQQQQQNTDIPKRISQNFDLINNNNNNDNDNDNNDDKNKDNIVNIANANKDNDKQNLIKNDNKVIVDKDKDNIDVNVNVNDVINDKKDQKNDDIQQQDNDNNDKKNDDDDDVNADKKKSDFYSHEKHVFIVTWGGRPLYSRYGSLNDKHMTSFMGVVSLFPSNVERVNILTQDCIHSFITSDTKFIYLVCGPLYIFCITKTSETIHQIRNQMRYYQLLIIMTLTSIYSTTLIRTPSFDMRNIFGPTDYMLLDRLVEDCNISPQYLFNSYYPLEISYNLRSEISSIIRQCRKSIKLNNNSALLYSLLYINGYLITYTQYKKRELHNEDIILLTHFVRNSSSWKQSENFSPICLPHFESSGFVYCYASYFSTPSTDPDPNSTTAAVATDPDICYLIITLDSTSFKKCQLLRKQIETTLIQTNLIQSIRISYDIFLNRVSTYNIIINILKIITPQVYIFYYNNIRKNQYIYPQPIKLYNYPKGRLYLFRRLQHLHNRIHSEPNNHYIYFERSNNDTSIAKLDSNNGYEIYIIMNNFVSKKDAQNVLTKLINWINTRAQNLFLNAVNW